MNISDARDQYRQSRKAQGVKAGSLRSEDRAVRYLLEVCGNIMVKNITPRHIDMLLAAHSNFGPATFNRTRSQLNTFFAWCRARGYMPRDHDPLEGLRKRNVPLKPATFIPPERFGELLDAAEKNAARDRAFVAMGLYLFTRAGETARIRWGKVNFDRQVVQVWRNKGEEYDDMPMCAELEHELRRWRLKYSERMGSPVQDEWIVAPPFTTPTFRHGPDGLVMTVAAKLKPYNVHSAPHLIVKRALREMGIDDFREGGHTTRRSGARAWFDELAETMSFPDRIVQSSLGHKNFTTTQGYLRLEKEKKERNDLLRGKRMFNTREAEVHDIGEARGRDL